MAEADAYTGTDNLEAMERADRYNAYLVDLAARYMPRDGRCLDFGAGIGTFAARVDALGFDVTALDPEAVHATALEALGLNTLASLDDVLDETFSGVWSFNVLEHIQDDVAALRDIHRVTAPGGVVVLYLPALEWLWTSMDDKVRHYRRYTRARLARKLEAADFRVEHVRYADSLGVVATLLFKVLGSRDGDIDGDAVALYDRMIFPLSRRLDSALGRVLGKNVIAVARRA